MSKTDLKGILRRALDAKAIRVEKFQGNVVLVRPPESSTVALRVAKVDVSAGQWWSDSGEEGRGWFSLARFLDLDFGQVTAVVE